MATLRDIGRFEDELTALIRDCREVSGQISAEATFNLFGSLPQWRRPVDWEQCRDQAGFRTGSLRISQLYPIFTMKDYSRDKRSANNSRDNVQMRSALYARAQMQGCGSHAAWSFCNDNQDVNMGGSSQSGLRWQSLPQRLRLMFFREVHRTRWGGKVNCKTLGVWMEAAWPTLCHPRTVLVKLALMMHGNTSGGEFSRWSPRRSGYNYPVCLEA